jgi:hypothetical protein
MFEQFPIKIETPGLKDCIYEAIDTLRENKSDKARLAGLDYFISRADRPLKPVLQELQKSIKDDNSTYRINVSDVTSHIKNKYGISKSETLSELDLINTELLSANTQLSNTSLESSIFYLSMLRSVPDATLQQLRKLGDLRDLIPKCLENE